MQVFKCVLILTASGSLFVHNVWSSSESTFDRSENGKSRAQGTGIRMEQRGFGCQSGANILTQ